MQYRFEFRPYRRRFVRSLSTSHGNWDIRDGIILRLTDENGQVGWGEIAPLSWFGSETLEQALSFCRQLPEEITDEMIFSIPSALPACQFGFESAWEDTCRVKSQLYEPNLPEFSFEQSEGQFSNLSNLFVETQSFASLQSAKADFVCVAANSFAKSISYSGLLPAGEAALSQWQTLWNQGYRTFKWKIGVYPIANELEIFQQLIQTLPASAKLRLDANGGLSYEEANLWLWTCDNVKAEELPVEIEFLEQPLSVAQFQGMAELSMCYATAIALDESVATIDQMEAAYHEGWRGIFVIKPCIAGSSSRLRQFCQQHEIDAVFSSVFETAIGRQAALKLAAELSRHNRAVGFGINHWFDEDEEI
ncbi:o-succinylbenzoate synthase [Coleofasciculus sp. FACHB-1120]|uniref:o-succinylbenzoate synthase n=1 Tax=Coleofasciculus sp. FACHB-1120 TaxID=2692783 RepID=UPI001686F312|nr:o-succinylbenzoate synthase [Coleofasciculus sp. FACHB-1120]MBD2741383.1 o-succinylbenzoate synthase [Coleofasciculus sp. FACHB-1120]